MTDRLARDLEMASAIESGDDPSGYSRFEPSGKDTLIMVQSFWVSAECLGRFPATLNPPSYPSSPVIPAKAGSQGPRALHTQPLGSGSRLRRVRNDGEGAERLYSAVIVLMVLSFKGGRFRTGPRSRRHSARG